MRLRSGLLRGDGGPLHALLVLEARCCFCVSSPSARSLQPEAVFSAPRARALPRPRSCWLFLLCCFASFQRVYRQGYVISGAFIATYTYFMQRYRIPAGVNAIHPRSSQFLALRGKLSPGTYFRGVAFVFWCTISGIF